MTLVYHCLIVALVCRCLILSLVCRYLIMTLVCRCLIVILVCRYLIMTDSIDRRHGHQYIKEQVKYIIVIILLNL